MALTTDTRFYFYLFSYPAVAIRYTLALHLNKPGKFPYATLLCNISFIYHFIIISLTIFYYMGVVLATTLNSSMVSGYAPNTNLINSIIGELSGCTSIYLFLYYINNFFINFCKWTAFVPELDYVFYPNGQLNFLMLFYVIISLYIPLIYAVFIYLIIW